MKKLSGALLSFVIIMMFYFSLSAQTNEVFLVINKIDGKIVTKAVNGEKTINFDIAGLTTKKEVDDFATKFKSMRGVVSITVSPDAIDSKWNATAVLYKYATKKYFQSLFTWLGIKYIMLENTKYLTEEIQTAKFE